MIMNKIKIEMMNLKYEGWLIANLNDLESYREMTDSTFNKNKHTLLRDYLPIERFDHIAYNSQYGNILKHVLNSTPGEDESHLTILSKMYDKKLRKMSELVSKGHKLIISYIGSYCTLLHDNYQIIDNYKKKITYEITTNTKWINLENDPYLESYTITNLSNIDRNYSYILESCNLDKSELTNILTEFKQQGGCGIWQYTTAMYIDQLYMYINTGIEVGLTNFEINFNAGRNMDIDSLINFYESNEKIKFNYNFVT